MSKYSKVEISNSEILLSRLRKETCEWGGREKWAQRHGVHASYVSKLLSGECKPTPRIAAALGFRMRVVIEPIQESANA